MIMHILVIPHSIRKRYDMHHMLVARYYVFSLSVCPSYMIPLSEADEGNNWKIPPNMSVALNLGGL